MRILKTVLVVLALSVLPLRAAAQQNGAVEQVVDRIVSQEQAEMNSLRPYSPMVETYIQNLRGDKDLGAVPAGDGSFHPLENGVDWSGAGASAGCARQRADQPGKGGLSGCWRHGYAASNGKLDRSGRELESAKSPAARIADEYHGGSIGRAAARFANNRRWGQQRARGDAGPKLFDCVRRARTSLRQRGSRGADRRSEER